MRDMRVVKAALPLLASAALIGSTTAPAASAHDLQTPHSCGASLTFLHKIQAFDKTYNKGAGILGKSPGTSQAALATYLNRASKFFNTSANEWASVGKYAPSSVSGSMQAAALQLKKTAADFGAAADAVKAGSISAMTRDVTTADKDAEKFGKALEPLVEKCI